MYAAIPTNESRWNRPDSLTDMRRTPGMAKRRGERVAKMAASEPERPMSKRGKNQIMVARAVRYDHER